MSALREAALAAVGAASLLAVVTGAWPAVVGAGLGAGGAWLLARMRGLGVASAALVAAGYATSATMLVGDWPQVLVAGALPWAWAFAPQASPRAAHLGGCTLGLVLVGPSVEGGGAPDLVAVGVLLALAGAGLALYRAQGRARELALLLVLVLTLLLLRRGPAPGWSLALVPGAWSSTFAPGLDAPVRAWVAAPVVLLAGAALLGGAGRTPPGALVPGTLLAAGLALGLPGLADTWRWLPLLGEVAPVSLAPLAALGLALLAGHTFQARSPRERVAVLALAVPLLLLAPDDPAPPVPGAPSGIQVTLTAPLAAQPGGELDLRGWIRGDLPSGALTLELAGGGWTHDLPTLHGTEDGSSPGFFDEPTDVILPWMVDGQVATFQLVEPLDVGRLPLGVWEVSARFEARGGTFRRPLGAFLSGEPPRPYGDLGPWLLAVAVLLTPSRGRWRWLAFSAVVAHGWFAAAMLLPAALPV